MALTRADRLGSVLCFLLLCMGPATALARAAKPLPGPAHAVGDYNHGRLEGAQALPMEGRDHYEVYLPRCYLRPEVRNLYRKPSMRNVFYGHPWAVGQTLRILAAYRKADPAAPRVALGEMSAQQGGLVHFHRSHQNGLDLDVFYVLRDAVAPGTALPLRDPRYPVAFCRDAPHLEVRDPWTGQWLLHPDFDLERNWAMLAAFARNPVVKEVFVGTLVLEKLRQWSASANLRGSRSAVLNRLKPVRCRPPRRAGTRSYKGNFCPHDDHFHVRFHCPPDDPACREGR